MLVVPDTVANLVHSRAEEVPDGGYRFLRDGAVVEAETYKALERSAMGVAARLASAGVKVGTPVLLLYEPGLEFVRAFFGTLMAGAVAVPVYPPNPARLARTLPRLRTIASDSGAKVILTSSAIHGVAEAMFPLAPELATAKWIATDGAPQDASGWKPPTITASDRALLQYTSGSTREPHGVMLSHGNLLHNQRLMREALVLRERDMLAVSWMPVYHDWGLIGKVLQPLYVGGSCLMMSPLEFLQAPHRWLAAISEHKAEVSGAPTFAYDLCVRKVTDEQVAKLDLSTWRVAACGAEPVRKVTLDRFAERFASCGFKATAFTPCYGLAEASLLVSGASRPTGIVTFSADEDGLRKSQMIKSDKDGARVLVGCGPVLGGQDVAIVVDGARVPLGQVGEIWISGESVGQGYWNKPEATTEIFEARLSDGTGPFLRTGDLGAFDATGELYVIGRTKDLLIVRGLNHHPHDIEKSAEEAWPGLRAGCTAAFALDGKDGEELIVVSEYDAAAAPKGVAWDTVIDAIRSAIGTEHEITPRAVVIVASGQVPKTPSGKVRRTETRRRYLANELQLLHRWEGKDVEPEVISDVPLETADQIATFLASWLSDGLGRAVAPSAAFSSLGIDSLDVVRMVDAVGLRLGRELDPTLALEHTTIEALAAELARKEDA